MNKHTPGPWRVSGVNSTDIEADSNSTFWAWVSVDTPEEERKPNALLIAAAPDLLEALENLENDAGQIPDYAWQMVKSAIRKAKGEII